jgi:CubicO group peptidase (beta-lactamase class C family)
MAAGGHKTIFARGALVCAPLVLASAACVASPPTFDRAPLDATLEAFVEGGRAVGVSALVYWRGEEAYFGAFGMRDREASLPMTRDTIVQIQSMTKPITGVALMHLYDEGAFELDDAIDTYASEFSNLSVWIGFDENGDPILEAPKRSPTIRDLTRHTSGFFTRGSPTPAAKLLQAVHPIDRNNTLTEFARKLATVPLLFHPGEGVAYGYSVDVQAFLIERMSGRPYAEYLQRRVLDPLAMADTAYYVPREKRSRMAAVYSIDDSGALVRAPNAQAFGTIYGHWPLTPGGHGLTSTLDDYMRFARMLWNDGEIDGVRVLEPETARLMAVDQLPETVTDRSWPSPDGDLGLGIDVAVRIAPPKSAEDKLGVVGEYYWEGALGTLFWIDPANDLVAVFFVQQSDYDSLHKDFRDAVYAAIGLAWADVALTATGAPASPASLRGGPL